MTSRPDGLDEDALSAHLRGDATPEETARIEAAAADDPALRAELALMGGLKGALGAATDGPDAREFGWKRLQAEIAAENSKGPVAAPPPPAGKTPLWRIAALFLGALVLGQGAYIALAPGAGDAPAFRTVSEEATAFGLAVGFAASAEMGAVEALLGEVGARVVDGPGAVGLYRLAFETAAARDAARETLAASPLVELVAEE
jgi:anti-sigma factor RsiW